jgi:hypothetical protein
MEQPFILDDVVTNSELACRKSRDPNYHAEAEALEVLAQRMAMSPESLLQKWVELALQLCHAGSAVLTAFCPAGPVYAGTRFRSLPMALLIHHPKP